jgi:hypothetical protein
VVSPSDATRRLTTADVPGGDPAEDGNTDATGPAIYFTSRTAVLAGVVVLVGFVLLTLVFPFLGVPRTVAVPLVLALIGGAAFWFHGRQRR